MIPRKTLVQFHDDEAKDRAAVLAMEAGQLSHSSIVLYRSGKRARAVRKLSAPNLINAAHLAKSGDYIVKIADQSGAWLHTITADERRALTSPAKQTEAAREIVGRYKETENVQ